MSAIARGASRSLLPLRCPAPITRFTNRTPTTRPLAVGGIHVLDTAQAHLTAALDRLCSDTGFPQGDEFKWSPRRDSWMYANLKADQRQSFFQGVLTIAASFSVTATVVIADTRYNHALNTNTCAEHDVTTMFLERVDNALGTAGATGTVFFDQPGGSHATEQRFLAECLTTITTGTTYAKLTHITSVETTVRHQARLLQLADVVTSCTCSYVAGGPYSSAVFRFTKPLLRSEAGRISGVGLKLHPDYRYRNLYYWLLGDTTMWKWSAGVELPSPCHPYYSDPGGVWRLMRDDPAVQRVTGGTRGPARPLGTTRRARRNCRRTSPWFTRSRRKR